MKDYLVKKASGAPDWDSIPVMAVEEIMWLPDVGISMTAQIAYDETALYLHQRAVERNIRAEGVDPLARVCEDSCMEFFLSPCPSDGRYLNFEINPNGALHLGFGHGRHDSMRLLPKGAEERFGIRTSRTEEGWEIVYRIPLEFLQVLYPELKLESGMEMRANCYKCGDCTVQPHYLAWNPPTSENPDFHRPQDFGALIFE